MPAPRPFVRQDKGTTGYSNTPLARKLGIKKGHRVLVQRGEGVLIGDLPPRARFFRRRSSGDHYDVILAFCRDRGAVEALVPRSLSVLPADGVLWMCWPKKSSGSKTDIVEGDVRQVGLDAGVPDVKICAINQIWSGLKFVVRLKDRPKWHRSAGARNQDR